MSSLLEDLFEEPLVPLADDLILQSGPRGLAATLGPILDEPAVSATAGAPKDDGHHGASLKKQARISDSGEPKDDGHHGKPAKQARFSEQLVSFDEPDDFPSTSQSSTCKSGSKELAITSDSGTPKDDGHHGSSPLEDFQSTSQSSSGDPEVNSCLSGPKGLAHNVASTDAIVTAGHVVNLETEIALLRSALDAKDLELSKTKVHAENYASKALRDSRDKAEKALAFQKSSFDTAHAEYSRFARDICDSEVAQSTAELEAIANSVIGQQQHELETASIIVSNLQQHLSHAQQMAAQETQSKLLVEAEAKANVVAQKASSAQQLSNLRSSLENDARASHSKIVNAREKQIKAEAEELHSASMKQGAAEL